MPETADQPDAWGARLRAARERAKLTQTGLGDLVGVGYRTVLRWEKEEHLPEREHWDKLAAVNKDFAALIRELPAEEDRRYDLAQRVTVLERRLQASEAKAAKGLKQLEETVESLLARVDELSKPRQRRAAKK